MSRAMRGTADSDEEDAGDETFVSGLIEANAGAPEFPVLDYD